MGKMGCKLHGIRILKNAFTDIYPKPITDCN
ncbi:hypothetical protein BCD_1032 (plasmid) [Borrelia crocidurae DOU]|uniref:Uncharacterized protein n=1 Tax=Borrelia crocidurae DOU TaxID=1293575 RepID=W5SKB4_9SPIR|nr:hypothetical protein BCD_1032 [Borrelia crocidurae DOU]